MHTRFQYYWQQLRESLWFVPSLMVLFALGLAYGLIAFDSHTSFDGSKKLPLLFGAGAEGSRSMLTAIAGSMLTVAALVFSLTLSTISQVSSQYSPRVLRNFMQDRSNQVVMGYFVGVFTYSLIVLGTIRGTEEEKFVPSTAVLMGLILALGGVVSLIFFIHHIAKSLQTGTIVQHISRETLKAIDEMFPCGLGEPVNVLEQEKGWRQAEALPGWQQVLSKQSGYVQSIDSDGLLRWAVNHGALLRVEQPIGAFVGEKGYLFSVRHEGKNADVPWSDKLSKLSDRMVIGRNRSIEQDVAFGIQQLVDIALKALSPGINDTTTAIMAVDYLTIICQRLAGRTFPPRLRSDGQHPRIKVKVMDFDEYIGLAFDLIRINAKGNHALFRRLLRALALIASAVQANDRKRVICEQAWLIMEYAGQTLTTDYEKQAVKSLYDELEKNWC